MANPALFQTTRGQHVPTADTVNDAGGRAYAFGPKHALAQLAITGCFNGTFYATAELLLGRILKTARQCDPGFVSKVAVYAWEQGRMKDTSAFLAALIAVDAPALLPAVFERVIINGKALRNFVQFIRSGVFGRKSIPRPARRLIRSWLLGRPDDRLFGDTVGQSPSIADVIKMVHPKAGSSERSALLGHIIGREVDAEQLPATVRAFEAYKATREGDPPNVPFRMLTALDLDTEAWSAIARQMPWTTLRINLNTLLRQGVFADEAMVRFVANKIADAEAVKRARAMPHQIMAAYMNVSTEMPAVIRDALHDAMEVAAGNVPEIPGRVVVCVDTSGSMQSPVTGHRRGATTKMKCVDVAALVASAIVRRNPTARVLAFDTSVAEAKLSARDTILTNARLLARNGGGTDCSAPLRAMVEHQIGADLVVFVSDNESWLMDRPGWQGWGRPRGTSTATAWSAFRRDNPKAKLVLCDLQPNTTTTVKEREDVLNVGGWSDTCFQLLADFAGGKLSADHWVRTIESVEI
jgi:60 kDa SS-A/Ro ribonucleoprotein